MKAYVCLAVMFLVFSYMLPREEYKKYYEFIVMLILVVLIISPLGKGVNKNQGIDDVITKIEGLSYDSKTDIYEIFKSEED